MIITIIDSDNNNNNNSNHDDNDNDKQCMFTLIFNGLQQDNGFFIQYDSWDKDILCIRIVDNHM